MQPMLAHKYEDKIDPTGWWMSEKYDGVRAIWNGSEFRSRTDKPLYAPFWFRVGMPRYYLDGELWCGRGQFQKTVGIVRSHEGNSDWTDVKYMVFDTVDPNKSFETRQGILSILTFPYHVQVVEQVKCKDKTNLETAKVMVVLNGGEGVMLRAPNSLYEFKRSRKLLKVKDMKYSTAVVIGYTEGKGKHAGRVGALNCEWTDTKNPVRDGDGIPLFVISKKITVGSGLTDEQRDDPPKIGSTVKIKYYDITEAGMPRFPIFEGVV